MKNKFLKITTSLLSAVFLFLYSCDDTADTFSISDDTTAPALAELTISDIVLDANNINNPAVTFTWQSAEYGQPSPIKYTVEFSKDDAFTAPEIAGTITSLNSFTMSTGELNFSAGNAGLNPLMASPLYVRVISSLGSQGNEALMSNTISLMVTPYFYYAFNDYYLVGDATSPGWNNNNNNPPLFRDPSDENNYTYTGFFSDGGFFKVVQNKGFWQPQWGTDDGTTVGVNPGGGSDPERFPTAGGAAVTGGFYTFTINFNTNAFTFEPFDASGITSPANIAIEGSAVAASTPLTPLSFDGHIWYANNVTLAPGELNFMAAGAAWGSADAFSGTATAGGANIPVPAGDSYDVWFNDLTGQYILIPLTL